TRRRIGPALMSPVWLVAAGYVGLAVAGLLFYGSVADASGGAGIQIELSDEVSQRTFWLILTTAAALTVGGTAGSLFLHRTRREAVAVTAVRTTPAMNRMVFRFAFLAPLLLIATTGTKIVQRDQYLANSSGSLSGPAFVLGHA